MKLTSITLTPLGHALAATLSRLHILRLRRLAVHDPAAAARELQRRLAQRRRG